MAKFYVGISPIYSNADTRVINSQQMTVGYPAGINPSQTLSKEIFETYLIEVAGIKDGKGLYGYEAYKPRGASTNEWVDYVYDGNNYIATAPEGHALGHADTLYDGRGANVVVASLFLWKRRR